jgi:hypothetical protein
MRKHTVTPHTPGPWRVHEDIPSDSYCPLIEAEDAEGLGSVDIANVSRPATGGPDNTEANAKLIAAAPELLEALKVIRNEVTEDIDGLNLEMAWGIIHTIRDMTDEAIDIATLQHSCRQQGEHMKTETVFTKLSSFETKFAHKGHTFILQAMDQGVYSAGRAVHLFQLDGLKRNCIVCAGWTRSDGYEEDFADALIKGITTMDKIKEEAINYINKLL